MVSWRSSAAYRLALLNFAAFAAGLALLGIVVFAVMHVSFMHQLDAGIAEEAQTLVSEYRSGGERELGEAIAEREQAGTPDRMLYAVFLPDGRRIGGSFQARRPELGFQEIDFIDPREGPDTAHGLGVDLSPNERLLVAADSEWIERIDRTVVAVFLVAFAAACALGFVGAALLGRYLRGRLQSISSAAEGIIAGHVRRRMPVSGRRDEFDQLAITLNQMLDRIEGLLENLRQVSSDVAHDLRTPLARLRSRLEEGLLRAPNDGGAGQLIEESISQVDDVLALFAAILRIAEVESGETRRFFAPVDVSELAIELTESYAPAVSDEGRTLLWWVDPGLIVNGDRELLAQALANLIENAQSHTPPGTLIRLTAIKVGEHVCLQVMDDGPGVPEADLVRIAKRFTRLDTSRNRKGYGLGLNLVSAAARLHHGQLRLKNGNPGLIAIIDLPRLTARSSGPSAAGASET